jgi:cytochrome b6-f complex iron-sulfur subunit
MSKEQLNDNGLSRRDFLTKAWWGLGILAILEFVGVGVAFLRPRKSRAKTGDFGSIITAGAVDDFKPNSVTAFRRGHFYLARLKDGGFLALSRKCTHLGCSVPWDVKENKFICPCHASEFDITGNVISPPAPRALELYTVKIENRIIKVDTNKPIKRKTFDKSQVVYV